MTQPGTGYPNTVSLMPFLHFNAECECARYAASGLMEIEGGEGFRRNRRCQQASFGMARVRFGKVSPSSRSAAVSVANLARVVREPVGTNVMLRRLSL